MVVIRRIPLPPESTDPHVHKYTLYCHIIGSAGATISLLNLHFILMCGISIVFPEYVIKNCNSSMHNLTVTIEMCNYVFWLDKVAIIMPYISEV
jgi:hypothetical protein